MYAFIRGTVEYKEDGMLAIDAGGMGYEVRVTEFVYMDTQEGGDVMLYLVCITNGTDGSRTLYGFQTRDEKRMFMHLISVTRIGGKVALAILSRLTLAEIASAVAAADPTPLSKVTGVGKKAAERIVLELKGKLTDVGITAEKAAQILDTFDEKQAAIDSLMGLGFSSADASDAVEAVSPLADTAEELVVLALKRLGM